LPHAEHTQPRGTPPSREGAACGQSRAESRADDGADGGADVSVHHKPREAADDDPLTRKLREAAQRLAERIATAGDGPRPPVREEIVIDAESFRRWRENTRRASKR